ncbi:MAG: 50S ribosomal protein L18 [Acidimicrobiia bacterium]|nr:50S ribosomal protein L18 [Acidimicrobiia bacterium]
MSRRQARDRRHRRVRKKIHGTANRPRLAVYKSNRYIYAQIIDDEVGRTLAAASSAEKSVAKKTLTVDSAAEVGKLLAKRASDANVTEVVFDRGGYPFHGRVKALADAVREAGVKF